MALADTLKKVLSSTVAYKVKSQAFHWNVEGPMFVQLHDLFGDIYEDAEGAIDPCAEHIRALEVYAPQTMKRFIELSVIDEQEKVPSAMLMVKELYEDGEKILGLLDKAFKEADTPNRQGIANFIADRQATHAKYCWQLNSLMK